MNGNWAIKIMEMLEYRINNCYTYMFFSRLLFFVLLIFYSCLGQKKLAKLEPYHFNVNYYSCNEKFHYIDCSRKTLVSDNLVDNDSVIVDLRHVIIEKRLNFFLIKENARAMPWHLVTT